MNDTIVTGADGKQYNLTQLAKLAVIRAIKRSGTRRDGMYDQQEALQELNIPYAYLDYEQCLEEIRYWESEYDV